MVTSVWFWGGKEVVVGGCLGQLFVSKLSNVTCNLFSALVVNAVVYRVTSLVNSGTITSCLGTVKDITGAVANTNVNINITYGLGTSPLAAISTTIYNVINTFPSFTGRTFIVKAPNRPLNTFVTTCVTVRVNCLMSNEAGISVVMAPVYYVLTNTATKCFMKPCVSGVVVFVKGLMGMGMTGCPVLNNVTVSILVNIVLALPVSSTTVNISVNVANLTTNTTAVNYYYGVINFTIVDCHRGGFNNLVTRKLNASVLRMPGLIGGPVL